MTDTTKAAMADRLETLLDVTLDAEQSGFIRAMLGDDPDEASSLRVLVGDGHSGYGLYACEADYPEEGANFIKELTRPAALLRVNAAVVPDGWKLTQKATCYQLTCGNTVVANLVGPDAEDNAAKLAALLAAPSAPVLAEPAEPGHKELFANFYAVPEGFAFGALHADLEAARAWLQPRTAGIVKYTVKGRKLVSAEVLP